MREFQQHVDTIQNRFDRQDTQDLQQELMAVIRIIESILQDRHPRTMLCDATWKSTRDSLNSQLVPLKMKIAASRDANPTPLLKNGLENLQQQDNESRSKHPQFLRYLIFTRLLLILTPSLDAINQQNTTKPHSQKNDADSTGASQSHPLISSREDLHRTVRDHFQQARGTCIIEECNKPGLMLHQWQSVCTTTSNNQSTIMNQKASSASKKQSEQRPTPTLITPVLIEAIIRKQDELCSSMNNGAKRDHSGDETNFAYNTRVLHVLNTFARIEYRIKSATSVLEHLIASNISRNELEAALCTQSFTPSTLSIMPCFEAFAAQQISFSELLFQHIGTTLAIDQECLEHTQKTVADSQPPFVKAAVKRNVKYVPDYEPNKMLMISRTLKTPIKAWPQELSDVLNERFNQVCQDTKLSTLSGTEQEYCLQLILHEFDNYVQWFSHNCHLLSLVNAHVTDTGGTPAIFERIQQHAVRLFTEELDALIAAQTHYTKDEANGNSNMQQCEDSLDDLDDRANKGFSENLTLSEPTRLSLECLTRTSAMKSVLETWCVSHSKKLKLKKSKSLPKKQAKHNLVEGIVGQLTSLEINCIANLFSVNQDSSDQAQKLQQEFDKLHQNFKTDIDKSQYGSNRSKTPGKIDTAVQAVDKHWQRRSSSSGGEMVLPRRQSLLLEPRKVLCHGGNAAEKDDSASASASKMSAPRRVSNDGKVSPKAGTIPPPPPPPVDLLELDIPPPPTVPTAQVGKKPAPSALPVEVVINIPPLPTAPPNKEQSFHGHGRDA